MCFASVLAYMTTFGTRTVPYLQPWAGQVGGRTETPHQDSLQKRREVQGRGLPSRIRGSRLPSAKIWAFRRLPLYQELLDCDPSAEKGLFWRTRLGWE